MADVTYTLWTDTREQLPLQLPEAIQFRDRIVTFKHRKAALQLQKSPPRSVDYALTWVDRPWSEIDKYDRALGERKRTIDELYGNLWGDDRERFVNELDLMAENRRSLICLEFPYSAIRYWTNGGDLTGYDVYQELLWQCGSRHIPVIHLPLRPSAGQMLVRHLLALLES